MEVGRILAEIDAQIAKLQQARSLLSSTPQVKRGPGRPRANAVSVAAPRAVRKRNLSPEGRKRIQEAMKRRWAEQKKTTSAKG